ncbi:hypothetical protein BKA66DRAFT_570191 [Pyrenochaeta sp. MPI-SDFR-AT-0127]|nr:hypothetical protein BKA66DRAFT_570191 [Pyrenochaeta sp. MPI-SDFR-AT-0127]
MPGGLNAPLEVILAWPKPNYVNPETRPNTILVLACVWGPLTLILVLARLWVRIFHQRNPGWDDWLMLAATPPTIVLTVLFAIVCTNGFDRHIWDLNLFKDSKNIVNSRKYVLAIECIFCVASGLIKVSILLFYRRLSSRVVSKPFRWATWISIGFIIAYSIALTLAPILGCQPISAFWDQVDPIKKLQGYKYKCFDEGADVFAASIISTVQDFITALLPTFLYWNLQIPIRQKMALFGIFAIGYGVVALGSVRAYFSWRTFYETYDVTWSTWDLMLTTMLELHIGAFCANAPALKVFFKHFFHDKLTSFSRTKTPVDSKNRKDSAYSGSKSTKSSASIISKISLLLSKSSGSRTKSGYISEPHTDVSVDPHGGVQIRKDVQVSHSPPYTPNDPTKNNRHESSITTDLIYDHYYDDIEMGRYTTGRNSLASSMRSTKAFEENDLSALPPMPTPSPSLKSSRSIRSIKLPSLLATMKELPLPPLPVATAPEKTGRKEKRLTPFPAQILDQTRPDWQSWA